VHKNGQGWGDFCALREISFSEEKLISRKPGAARAKKLTHPKPREKKKTEGQKISGRGSKFEGAQNLRGEGLKI
jgi:hypothetical protein